MWKEFKTFALRGNVVDLAVGVVIGAAFGTVVTSFVNDVLMQLIAAFGDAPDFSAYTVTLGQATIRYGSFVNAIVSFLIVAFALFLVIKGINRVFREKETDEPDDVKSCPYCLTDVPDAATRCPACTSKLAAA